VGAQRRRERGGVPGLDDPDELRVLTGPLLPAGSVRRAAVHAVPPGQGQFAGERGVVAGILGGDVVEDGPLAAHDDHAGDADQVVLRTVAARHEASPARVAIAWLLAQRAVTSVIVGARRPDQLTDDLAAGDLTLTEQDLSELDEVSRPPVAYPNWLQEAFAPTRIPAAGRA
jgi:Aldo/keto reductase family